AAAGRTESRLVSFQYVPLLLQGGAPWGFTLTGGLEHGEPLLVSKIEDGGKAALSRKMRTGDELVNINGTPLYGSRQEALILIKGSYRTLKMIIRRRNVPVIRPHSWHLAKFSEVRNESATMHCPSDAFSLSWHSGCDASALSLQWNQISRHCSTDKSSSIGSMESLDQPSQAYYEGHLSPIDQSLYQNKRDSAYSSFSASSNASDYALSLRPEETSSTDSILQGLGPCKHHDGRYLQTGTDGAESPGRAGLHQLGGHPAPNSRPSSCPHESNFSSSSKAPIPPQPPTRRDSLRVSNPQPPGIDKRRASAPPNSMQLKGRWTSDTFLSLHDKEHEGPCGQALGMCPGYPKERLSADQYYMLSSHPDRQQRTTEQLMGESLEHPQGMHGLYQDRSAMAEVTANGDLPPSPWKGHMAHRHSAPEQLLASQLHSLEVASDSQDSQVLPVQDGHQWTVSPLHSEQQSPIWCPLAAKDPPCGDPAVAKEWANDHAAESQCSAGSAQDAGHCQSPYRCSPEPERPCGEPGEPAALQWSASLMPGCSIEMLAREGKEHEKSKPANRKMGPSHHRSAHMRRRNERFATNLRNEIQKTKAQLQKSKGSSTLLHGEELVEETEPSKSTPSRPASPIAPAPSPPVQSQVPSPGDRSSTSMARARPEPLNPKPDVASTEEANRSPRHLTDRNIPVPEPVRKGPCPPPPDKEKPMALAGRRRWKWSPEHKLQPHLPQDSPSPHETEVYTKGPDAPVSPPRLPEDAVLLPFADRRKFFEESSRSVPGAHHPGWHRKLASFRPKAAESNTFQPVDVERWDLRRHSMDQSYTPLSPGKQNAAACPECCLDSPVCYKPVTRHRDFEYLRAFPYTCTVPGPVLHEPCHYCSRDMCPGLVPRNMQTTHHGYHCHPHPWAHCSDCCCPSSHKVIEESEPWPLQKSFIPEFPLDEWEPAAINRKASQSVSELSHYKISLQKGGPFQPCFESSEQEWPKCYRATSSLDLSWDGDQAAQGQESPAYEESLPELLHRPLRGRAFSESHLNIEPPSPRRMERRDIPSAKLDATRPEPPCPTRKKGPPPPRPPPPNWEKYRTRRTSHYHVYPPESSGSISAFTAVPLEQSHQQNRSSVEAARQRSQSLPLDKHHGDSAKPPAPSQCRVQFTPPQESTIPTGTGQPPEQGSHHYYCPSSLWRTPELPGLDVGTRDSPRPDGFSEEGVKAKTQWDKGRPMKDEQYQVISWGHEQPRPSPPSLAPKEMESAPENVELETCRLGVTSRQHPCRMDSEELMRDVAGRDSSLASVLTPAASMVTTAKVMGELFSAGDQQAWKDQRQQDWLLEKQGEAVAHERQEFQPISPPPGGAISPTSYSAYYNTSAGKAELLNKMKELPDTAEGTSEDEEVDHELAQKKAQLIESLSRKLSVLQEAQRGLQDDISANTALGEEVESQLKGVCKPNELDKFRLFVGDLDRVVNLLLSLSGRLARVENALNSLGPEATEEEKVALIEKKRQLSEQLEDAKELKEHVGRRERVVYEIVSRYLLDEQLQDYQHFVKMKSALLIEQRELEEKIKLGEEQLKCLRESLLLGPKEC
ncbi:PREDICTED: protein Shroom4, partial [Gavialis gangeticus]|uniref:protein Shroom4 n=1 Tax=Gavialis gangeticus TaxID=94835 RepID=UPI00092F67DD